MIIAVQTDRESLGVRTDNGHDIRSTAVKVPGDESHRGVKVVLLHLCKQSRVVKMSIGFDEPGVIDCQICISPRKMPPLVAACRPKVHKVRCSPFGKDCWKIRDR